MNTQKHKKMLFGFLIALVSIAVFAALTYAASYMILYLIFGPSEVPEDEKIVEFPDGSILERTGGPTYTHTLFGEYAILYGDNSFESRLVTLGENKNLITEDQWGKFFKYAFSDEGYIAYRFLDRDNTYDYGNEPDETTLYEFNSDEITADKNILYDCNTDTILEFESMNDLCDYCTKNNIRLGLWYYPTGYSSNPEEIYIDINGWKLALNLSEYYETVYNDSKLLFAGTIDKYFITDRYLSFRFRHLQAYDYAIEENPIIEYNPQNIIGKKFLLDIYTEAYVFIDTQTDAYIIFNSKKEVNEYAKSLGFKPDWEKIKYTDK